MRIYKVRNHLRGESGFTLIAVMILVLLSMFLITNLHDTTQSDIRSAYAIKKRTERYYNAEYTLHLVSSWMRENSQLLITPFKRENFYTLFDRTNAVDGDNDSAYFTMPTRLKINGTNDSVVLSNNDTLVTSNYPNTSHIISGVSFDAQAEFSAADFGSASVRVTLVDAIGLDTAKDYGDTDLGNPTPETDFQPIYRIDVFTDLDRGTHVYTYLRANLHFSPFIGFYGEDEASISRDCDSYESDTGSYSVATRLAGCTAGSKTLYRQQSTNTLYGSVSSQGSITSGAPWGGAVCSDFLSGCPNAGSSCEGASCDVISFQQPDDWDTYCTSDQGDFTPASSQSLPLVSDAPADSCWNSLTINGGVTVTLTTTQYNYYFKTITVQPGGVLQINPGIIDQTITVVSDSIQPSNAITSTSWLNAVKPYQFSLWYMGSDALSIDAGSSVSLFLSAPNAGVSLNGAGDYFGSIRAKTLSAEGTGALHYDASSMKDGVLSDVRYQLRLLGQQPL